MLGKSGAARMDSDEEVTEAMPVAIKPETIVNLVVSDAVFINAAKLQRSKIGAATNDGMDSQTWEREQKNKTCGRP